MKLGDFISSLSNFSQTAQGIEGELLQRRRTGSLAALAGALIQLVTLAVEKEYLEKLGNLLKYLIGQRAVQNLPDSPELFGLPFLVLGFGIYLLLRWSNFLLKESREPFRYTFWIEPFTEVQKAAAAGEKSDEKSDFNDKYPFHLLHHDLRERIDRRFRRFSLLQNGNQRSHVHISGKYARREKEDGPPVIHLSKF